MTKRLPRGGHFPGHIRDEFLEAIEGYYRKGDAESVKRLYELSGKLWNCSDILPGGERDMVVSFGHPGDYRAETYAQASRSLRQFLPIKYPKVFVTA